MTPFLQRVIVIALIVFGVWIAGFFGLQTLHAYKEVREHRPPPPPFKTEQPETDVALIEDWMTVPFIGRMYLVPPPLLFEALQVPAKGNQEKSLKQINEIYYPDQPGYVLELVKTTVEANLPSHAGLRAKTPILSATAVPGAAP